MPALNVDRDGPSIIVSVRTGAAMMTLALPPGAAAVLGSLLRDALTEESEAEGYSGHCRVAGDLTIAERKPK